MFYNASQHINECGQEEFSREELFWREHYPRLQRYCHFLTKNKWEGDDIAQDTFLKAAKHYPVQKMQPGLLNKMAYHTWIDLLRKRKNERVEADFNLMTDMVRPEHLMDTVDLLLKSFTPKQAVIFVLKEAFQYQAKEIAEMIGIAETAVKSNLHRAKKRLERERVEEQPNLIEHYWNEEDKEQLSEVLYQTLIQQDPEVLIEAIPVFVQANKPKLVSPSFHSSPTCSPLSTLCMAA